MLDISKVPQKAPEYDLESLLEMGCHFGHQKSKWHPKMKPYIFMEKDGVHIFDLAKTAAQLQAAYNYAHYLGSQKKTMVVVGTKKQAKDIVEQLGTEMEVMFISSRWLGGLLTNWPQVKKSIQRMKDLEDGLKEGKFKGYTKYELMQFEKEVGRLQRFFGGIRNLKQRPDALFVVDPGREKIAVLEAVAEKVPLIALVDSNADPTPIDIVIPANDDSKKSLEFIVAEVIKGYTEGRKTA